MKIGSKIGLSLAASALLLLTGCGSDTTQESQNVTTVTPFATSTYSNQAAPVALQGLTIQTLSKSESNSTVQRDVLHLLDGDLLHLAADEAAMGVEGNVTSYVWRDMDGIVLSETSVLDRVLYYDPQYDHNQDGTTKYIKTVTITTDNGKVYTKSYTVYVHKDTLPGGQVILGPLAQAHYTLRKLHDSAVIDEGATTQGDGVDVNSAGIIPLSAETLNSLEGGYYLMTVAGGMDIDRDDDMVWDSDPTVNKGVLHAIVRAEDLQRGNYKVNIFTQAIYQYLAEIENLAQMSDAQLQQRMDELSAELLAVDLNGDGLKDYGDILLWNPATDKEKLLIDYTTEVLPYVEKILSGTGLHYIGKYVVAKKVTADTEIEYSYDSKGLLVEENTYAIADHAPVQKIVYTYDDRGSVIEKAVTTYTTGAEPTLEILTFSNSYDNDGRLIEQKTENTGVATRWIYDEAGLLTERQVGIYNAESYVPYEFYYYENGKLASARIDRGEAPKQITYETDQYGNVIREQVEWFGETFITEYSYEYDVQGNILKKYKDGVLLFEQSWERV